MAVSEINDLILLLLHKKRLRQGKRRLFCICGLFNAVFRHLFVSKAYIFIDFYADTCYNNAVFYRRRKRDRS